MEDPKHKTHIETVLEEEQQQKQSLQVKLAEKLARKKSERFTYLIAAVMSSFGITSLGVLAVYYRFSWQMEVNCGIIIKFIFLLCFFCVNTILCVT